MLHKWGVLQRHFQGVNLQDMLDRQPFDDDNGDVPTDDDTSMDEEPGLDGESVCTITSVATYNC